MLKLLLEYHNAGLLFANHHQSIAIVAHLYNALRQLRLLEEDWLFIDRIIAIHKRALFADYIPSRTSDIADRLSYRLNAHNKQTRYFEDGKHKFKEPETVQIFRSLLDTTERNDRVVWQIEQQIMSLEDTTSESVNLKGKSAKARPAQQLHQLTLEGYISGVQTAFSHAIYDLSIEYIQLTKRCIALLDDLRHAWNEKKRNEGMADT